MFSVPLRLPMPTDGGVADRLAKPRHRIFGTFRLFDQLYEGILHEVFGILDVPTPSVEEQCRISLIDKSDEFFGGEKRHSVAFVSLFYKGKRSSRGIIPKNFSKELGEPAEDLHTLWFTILPHTFARRIPDRESASFSFLLKPGI